MQATSAVATSLARGCPVVAVALLLPGRLPLLLGPVASGSLGSDGLSGLAYPADGSIVEGTNVSLSEQGCGERGPARAEAELQSLSLFAGTVSAHSVGLALGRDRSTRLEGLSVGGRQIAAGVGARVGLGSWGYLQVRPRDPVRASGGGAVQSALAVHLLEPHAGLPAGTVVLVAAVGVPGSASRAKPDAKARRRAAKHRKRRLASHQPLTETPPLGLRHYIFPVAGPSEYVDTYGAFRSDVPGNWHHGDDIFAALGTPVVAVASGTINRVGWEKLGGWRLWVRDSVGDEFYYAHLSGYAPTDLRSNRVQAGDVIGFIGNTGDAFTTSPHLHFEIHPRQLLHLHYDGAVDPTSYLNKWTHVQHPRVPIPTHPPLPSDPALRQEARYVFRELLAARHLIKHSPKASERPRIAIAAGANGLPIAAPPPPAIAAAAARSRPTDSAGTILTFAVAFTAVAGSVALLLPVWRSRRRRIEPDGDPTDAAD